MRNLSNKFELRTDTLSEVNLRRLKWATTIAVFGIPALIQLLGAMIAFSQTHPVLLSLPVLLLFALMALIVIGCGLYAFSNRVFLRFSISGNSLKEWETKTRTDAFAFSYKIIVKAILLLFVGISLIGAVQAAYGLGWIGFQIGASWVLNIEAIAAMTIMLTYLTLLLPTLYIAWTVRPLEEDPEIG